MNQAMRIQVDHSKVCTGGMLEFFEEKKKGLRSTFIYKCNMCDKLISVHTEHSSHETKNKAFVWGTLATGSIYEHSTELLSVLDVPQMSRKMFFNIQRELGSVRNMND